MNIQDILKEENVHIIDVRESSELLTEKIDQAINMPLSKFEAYVDNIKTLEGKKVIFCRSGGRSGQAVTYLQSIGIKDVYNGGGIGLMQTYLI